MPSVVFTSHLRRLAPAGPLDIDADTVGGALAAVFAEHPMLEGYVLDDQKRLRRHIAVFVDSERASLDAPVASSSRITVLQALSGG
jgi:hypothetical protein